MKAITKRTEITGPLTGRTDEILTADARDFVALLHRQFNATRMTLMRSRAERQAELDARGTLQFLPETRALRDANWTVAPVPKDLQDRRVEITGPVERKMMINAFNSAAKVFMADFE